MSTLPLVCERARFQISATLDAEASELDRRLVASHVVRCADCRAFADSAGWITEHLREARLEAPATPFVLARNRRRRVVTLAVAEYGAAAMLAVAVVGVVGQIDAPDRPGRTSRVANLFQASWPPEQELAQIQPVEDVRSTAERPGPLPAL